jgi:hypothetical protein
MQNNLFLKIFVVIFKYINGIELIDKYYASGNFICSGAQVPREGG